MRLIEGLALTCKSLRTGEGNSLAAVAAAAGVSESAVRAFEHGQTWPRDVEELVSAYADLAGKSASALWRDAAGLMDEELP